MSESLTTLLSHTERQRDQQLAAVARSQALLQRVAAQTEQLLSYRNDCRQRGPAQAGRSATIELLRYHQGFLQRLDQALDQLSAQQQTAEQGATCQREALLALEMRLASVRKLQGRRADAARVASDRREQRQSDEAAQHRRQRPNLDALPAGL